MSKKTTTTEATGKGWKACRLIGGLALVLGVSLVVYGCRVAEGDGSPWPFVLGLVAVVGGCAVWILGRLGSFWFHG